MAQSCCPHANHIPEAPEAITNKLKCANSASCEKAHKWTLYATNKEKRGSNVSSVEDRPPNSLLEFPPRSHRSDSDEYRSKRHGATERGSP